MPDAAPLLERCLLALEHEKDARVRVSAALELVELAAQSPASRGELAGILPRLLDDGSFEIRCVGLELASLVLTPEEAFPLFVARLRDAAPRVRLEAAGRLADQARPEVRAPLAGALEDDNFLVRFEAARGMAALQHPAGLDVLLEALGDGELRYRALGALAELGDARALPAVKAVFRKIFLSPFERTQAAGALARLGDADGVKHLFARTRRRWTTDRSLAVELLGEVRAAGAFERLVEILDDPRDGSRGAAARGLGRLGDTRAWARLQSLLENDGEPEDLRLDAAEGLCHADPVRAREPLAGALQRLPTPEARAELQSLLDDLESET